MRGDQCALGPLARARGRDHQYTHAHLLASSSRPPAVRARARRNRQLPSRPARSADALRAPPADARDRRIAGLGGAGGVDAGGQPDAEGGTVLFAINQLDVLLAGRATGLTWLKVALTYLVPFLVSNYGVLSATRSRRRPS